MPEAPYPDCWLHPDLVVRPSPIAGVGLFARAVIPADTIVSRLGGRLVTDAELAGLIADPATGYVDTVSVAEGINLVLPPDTPNGKGNHGCDPNAWWTGDYEVTARRPLEPGEEMTVDYGTLTDDPGYVLDCACGSPLCRGTVAGLDWRRPDLRRRYGEHWVPALRRRIRADPA